MFEDETFGLDGTSLADQIILYPVPVKNVLYIDNTLDFDLEITVYTQLGQKIIQTTINQNELKQLSLENLSSGVYLVKLNDGNRIFYKKILKE